MIMRLAETAEQNVGLKVIDQDQHVRISFNANERFLKMEVLRGFDRVTAQLLRDTLAIVADVVQEQRIDRMLIDFLSLRFCSLKHLGGVECYPIILRINQSLQRLAILCGDIPVEDACRRVSRNVVPVGTVRTFLDEGRATCWVLGQR